jgi:hypothetical protein
MKIALFFAIVITTQLTWGQSNKAENIPLAELGDHKKETDLKAEQSIAANLFSLTAPAGWSYLNVDYSKKPAITRGDYRAKITTTDEIILAPTPDVGESEVFVSVRNYSPKAFDIVVRHRTFKDKGGKLSTKKWNGREWKLLEYTNDTKDVEKYKLAKFNWYATTHLKNQDLTVHAGAPTPELRDKYRTQIEAVLASIKVKE